MRRAAGRKDNELINAGSHAPPLTDGGRGREHGVTRDAERIYGAPAVNPPRNRATEPGRIRSDHYSPVKRGSRAGEPRAETILPPSVINY